MSEQTPEIALHMLQGNRREGPRPGPVRDELDRTFPGGWRHLSFTADIIIGGEHFLVEHAVGRPGELTIDGDPGYSAAWL